jgi:Prealbumin-like fold domain
VSETGGPSGYAFDGFTGDCANPSGDVTLANGESKTCTLTNNDKAATLTVIKHVVNDNGGTNVAADWSIHVKSGVTDVTGSPQAGAESPGTEYTLDAGTYTVSETGGPSGYAFDGFTGDCANPSGDVTLANGESKTCTLTNNDVAPQLIVIKHVINDNGGTAVASDFTLDSGGANDTPDNFAGAEAPGTTVTLDAGGYDVSETGPAGYTESDSADCAGSIAIGETKTCTVTNDDIAQVTSKITPTGTTCDQFNSNTASQLSTLQYTVKSGSINQVSPGVFFYWVKVTAVAGSNTVTIDQTITTGNFDSHFFNVASGSNVFTSSCTAVKPAPSITQSGATTTITFNASSAGTYIIGVKYDAGSVKGFAAPSPTTTVHYDFQQTGFPTSKQGIDLVKKP